MWYVRDVLYAVLYVRVSCFVVCGCGVSRRYIDVCYCDMFSGVNVYLDHLKFCVVCINSRRYVCCSKCDVVCNEPTSSLVQPIGAQCCEVMYFWCFGSKRHSLQAVELSQQTQAAVQIVSNLPAPKNGGPIYLFFNHFLHATHRFYVILSILYTLFLSHGFSPDSMIMGTMIPIPKNRKQL